MNTTKVFLGFIASFCALTGIIGVLFAFDIHNLVAGEPFNPLGSMRSIGILIMAAINLVLAFGIYRRRKPTLLACRFFCAIYGAVFLYYGVLAEKWPTAVLGVGFVLLGFYFAGPRARQAFE